MGLSGMWLLVSDCVGPVAYWSPIGFLWAAARMVLQDILGYKLYAYSDFAAFSAIFWEGIKPYSINFSLVHLG